MDYDGDYYIYMNNHSYTDPLLPPDVFNYEEKRKGFWLLYALGFYIVTSAATFITHNFMVKGVLVGLGSVDNKKVKSVIEPMLVSLVKSWPKFVLAVFGHFFLFSSLGDFTILGSVGFNLHIGVAVALLVMAGSHPATCCTTFLNLLMLLISGGFLVFICDFFYSGGMLQIILSIVFTGFFCLFMLLPLMKGKDGYHEEYNLEDNDEVKIAEHSDSCFFPATPTRAESGSGCQLFIDWLWFINNISISFIPFMTMFWCNPSNKRYRSFWPAAVILGGVWVAGLVYLSVWWVTVFSDSLGVPPELSGLVFTGPLLSAINLAHIGISARQYVWQGITEDILADSLVCLALPRLFMCILYYTPIGGYPHLIAPPLFDFHGGMFCGIIILINLVFSHLLTLMIRYRAVRILQAVILIIAYPIIFIAGACFSIYDFIPI